MTHNKMLSGGILILIIFGIVLGYKQAIAQPGIAEYLEQRLKQHDVSVVRIRVLQESPLRLEITIQSRSREKKALPEDPFLLHWVDREVLLANSGGFNITSYVKIVINQRSEVIYSSERFVYGEGFPNLPSPTVTDNIARDIALSNMNMRGMTVSDLRVLPLDGLQILTLQLSVPSLMEANQTITPFISSLGPTIANINAQGSQIVLVHVKVLDESENILLDYVYDIQDGSQNWWAVDGLIGDWYPRPSSVPE